MTPRATYRMQFHAGFTFADAEAVVPYLDDLGISHIYASPVTLAHAGSTHGYDVVDPTRINPELGGEAGLRSLVAELRRHGMGLILDIVPNHMGVGAENLWWYDVLKHGPASRYVATFDVDWSRHGGRMLLPFLGAPLGEVIANGDITVISDGERGEPVVLVHGEQEYPLRPETHPGKEDAELIATGGNEGRARLAALLDRQHYRLAWWKAGHDELNWRRFFSITELAGVRVEDDLVFEQTHALYFRLYAEGLVDGLRVDHVDGLTDPAGYCRKLRARLGELEKKRPAEAPSGPAWLLVEKILGPGEHLATDWGIDGTTGYEFMNEVSAVMHAPDAAELLAERWAALSGRPADFAKEERLARRQMLAWEFGAQLDAVVRAFLELAQVRPETAGLTGGMLRRAAQTLLEVFPVYRTYCIRGEAPEEDRRVRELARERARAVVAPGELPVVDQVLAWLAGEGGAAAQEAVRLFQQLSAPIAAKAVEDTAFYRYGRLLSRNDVGFDSAQVSMSIDAFHRANQDRARRFPHAMITTATHDHKRGEDIRARLAVLSTVPVQWNSASAHWLERSRDAGPDLDHADLYMLLQMAVGAWPDGLSASDPEGLAAFAARLQAWQVKALREAKLRSSWAAPDEAYERLMCDFISWVLTESAGRSLLHDIRDFVAWIEPAADANSLIQAALRCTLPGVPDLYQGTEFPDFSLVDPDNRRPVDYVSRAQSLVAEGEGCPKQALLSALLGLRREAPALFAEGAYVPVRPREGTDVPILAFARLYGSAALICGFRLRRSPADMERADDWRDIVLQMPAEVARLTRTPRLSLGELAEGDGVLSADLADAGIHIRMFGTAGGAESRSAELQIQGKAEQLTYEPTMER